MGTYNAANDPSYDGYYFGPASLIVGTALADGLAYRPAPNKYGFLVWESHEIFGGAGDDTLEAGWSYELPPSNITASLYGELGNDHLKGAPLVVDRLYGGPGDDYIEGYSDGEARRDLYYGGSGDDILQITDSYYMFARCVGGIGYDTFLFREFDPYYIDPAGGADGKPVKIADFETGVDEIVFAYPPGDVLDLDLVYRKGKGKLIAKHESADGDNLVIAKFPKGTRVDVDTDVLIDA